MFKCLQPEIYAKLSEGKSGDYLPIYRKPYMNITESTFKKEVLESELPTMVDFWAPWCYPCTKIMSTINELATEYKDKLKVVKLNIDEAQALARTYQIKGVPSFLFFKDGKQVDSIIGAQQKSVLVQAIEKII